MFSRVACAAVLVSLACKSAHKQEPPTPVAASRVTASWANDPTIERRVNDLVTKMTLDEKLGQLTQISSWQTDEPATPEVKARVATGQVGSILGHTGAKETNELQRIAVERTRLKIPLLFAHDVIHGYRTTFPIPLALSATWDAELVQRVARVAAREAYGAGLRWTFSPMVDIARDARWGRISEGAGEDPYLGSVMAKAYVRGYQGDGLGKPDSVAACAKHFVGYGAAEGGRDYNTTYIPERLLREVYLPPFQAAVDSGVASLMSGYHSLNDMPTTANRFLLDQVLRKEWGFRGFVISDLNSVDELIRHGIANDGVTAARKALTAGVDIDMDSGDFLKLGPLVKSGALPISVIDEAVRRVLRVKLALGLFERPYTEEKPAPVEPVDVAIAKQAALQSFVLLKNGPSNAPVLPIAPGVRRIALIGPLADDAVDMLGSWTQRGNPKWVTTLRTALTAYAKDHHIDVAYELGVELLGPNEAGIPAAVAAAQRADVVVLAVGEKGEEMTGEAASRTRIDLPGKQPKLIEALAKTGKPIVLVVFSGRPLALTPHVDHVAAIIEAWHPGVQAGPALVDVLTGSADFTGRLTVTFPRHVGQLPLYYNALNTGKPVQIDDLTRPGPGDARYASRYTDELNAPLFPFGFGLSYARFEYSPTTASAPKLSARAVNAGTERVTVRATVRNTSERDGVETAQVYLRLRGTSVSLPVRSLKGFKRIPLRKGDTSTVEFTLGRDELAFWNADMKHVAEPALLTVWIAHDSSSGTPVEIQIAD